MVVRALSLFVGFLFGILLGGPLWASPVPVSSVSGVDLLSGQSQKVEIDKSHPTAFVFLSAHCPCSASHEPILKSLAKEFPEVRFIGIHSNADEPVDEARTHFKDSGLGFAVIQDNGAQLADAFKAFKTPHAFLADTKGEVIYSGGVTDSHDAPKAKATYLKDALTALREGKEPPRKEARSLGCVISRK